MNIQNASVTMVGSTYTNVGKVHRQDNERTGNANKTANSNSTSVVVQLSPKSQFDKMIEKLQEQIQKINENEHYGSDTKKEKIEELEKQIKELEKAKTVQASQSSLGKNTEIGKNASGNNTTTSKTNADGDILDLNTKALLQADNSLKSMKEAHSMKVSAEGSARVLASEIKMDKERGLDTTKKEEQLAQIKETAQNSIANMGSAIRDVNITVQDISAGTESAGTESSIDETSNTPHEQAEQVIVHDDENIK